MTDPMKIKVTKQKCTVLKNCKGVIQSDKYIVGLTGRRAQVVRKSDMTLVGVIKGLSYVYRGDISPDEKILLLASTDRYGYLYSLPDLTPMSRARIRDNKSGEVLEGLGCFSHDGSKVYFAVPLDNSLSEVREYDPITFGFRRVVHELDGMVIREIQRLKNGIFLSGFCRGDEPYDIAVLYENGSVRKVKFDPQRSYDIIRYDEESGLIHCVELFDVDYYTTDGKEAVIDVHGGDEDIITSVCRTESGRYVCETSGFGGFTIRDVRTSEIVYNDSRAQYAMTMTRLPGNRFIVVGSSGGDCIYTVEEPVAEQEKPADGVPIAK